MSDTNSGTEKLVYLNPEAGYEALANLSGLPASSFRRVSEEVLRRQIPVLVEVTSRGDLAETVPRACNLPTIYNR